MLSYTLFETGDRPVGAGGTTAQIGQVLRCPALVTGTVPGNPVANHILTHALVLTDRGAGRRGRGPPADAHGRHDIVEIAIDQT